MKKINRAFISIGEEMEARSLKIKIPTRYNPQGQSEILGGFQPLADIVTDVQECVKPYKFSNQLKRDLMQPLRGAGNIIVSLMYLAFALTLLLDKETPWQRNLSWAIYSLSNIFKGVTQCLFTPFTWLIKIPLRGLITLFNPSPQTNWEDKDSVQSLVESAQNIDEEGLSDICTELHRKFLNACDKGKTTAITPHEETNIYVNIFALNDSRHIRIDPVTYKKYSNQQTKYKIEDYLSLFSSTSRKNNESTTVEESDNPQIEDHLMRHY